jgi:hypothetical protein
MPSTSKVRWFAVTTLVLLATAACGDDSSSSAGTTTTTESVCDQATALKASVQDLKNVDVVKNGTAALQAPVATIQKETDALIATGKQELQPQADAFKSSLTVLQTAVSEVEAKGVASVATAASSAVTAADALLQQTDSLKC